MRMKTRSASAIFLSICCIALGAADVAQAADAKPAAATRTKVASAVMSKEELGKCLDQKESVRSESEGLDKERASLATATAALEKRSTDLSDRLALLDRTSASAVDAHNAEVAERETAVDALKARIDAFNSRTVVVREHQQAFEKSCGNKLYEVRDENAIRKAK